MKENLIDLLVERLQGTFPTSKISPKAVLATWHKDEFLQRFPDELGAMLRDRLQENCNDFPSLKEVRFHARKLMPRTTAGDCDKCSGNRWLPEMDGDEPVYRVAYAKKGRDADGSPVLMMWQRNSMVAPEPVMYHFTVPCRCVGDDDF
jgi:hypothetical protein